MVHEAGGSPAASYFLLLRQRKVTKEKATRVHRPAKNAGFPALLEATGRCGTPLLFAIHCHCPCMGNGVRGLAACGSNSPLTLAECPCRFCVARRLSRDPPAFEFVVEVTELGSRLSMETPFGAREQGVLGFVSDFHFAPRYNFSFFRAHRFRIALFYATLRIREFPCCRANILEKGRGFPRKLFEAGAITSTRATSRLRQPSCFRGPTLFRNVGNPKGAQRLPTTRVAFLCLLSLASLRK